MYGAPALLRRTNSHQGNNGGPPPKNRSRCGPDPRGSARPDRPPWEVENTSREHTQQIKELTQQ
ncbi:Hypothetical predicted protein, partial [Pelobates cultripes]